MTRELLCSRAGRPDERCSGSHAGTWSRARAPCAAKTATAIQIEDEGNGVRAVEGFAVREHGEEELQRG
jgi:hypothetical protein